MVLSRSMFCLKHLHVATTVIVPLLLILFAVMLCYSTIGNYYQVWPPPV